MPTNTTQALSWLLCSSAVNGNKTGGGEKDKKKTLTSILLERGLRNLKPGKEKVTKWVATDKPRQCIGKHVKVNKKSL